MPRDAITIDNDAIANVLDEIGDLIELKGENVFRAVTYRQVARSIRDLREPVATLVEQGRPRDRADHPQGARHHLDRRARRGGEGTSPARAAEDPGEDRGEHPQVDHLAPAAHRPLPAPLRA